nr:hypothetical protein [Tanacetum cinerariifolium]
MTESPLVDSGFAVPVFSLGDDLIACLNKAMAFLTAVASSRHARVVKCYNCQGEGHMARQCSQPKRPTNETWYKEKAMLAEAQEAGQILDEEQLTFLVDLEVLGGQAVQKKFPNNEGFQTEDLDTYELTVMISQMLKRFLMANISNYGSDIISDVPHSETYLNDMENQIFKNESKEKEDKYMENKIDLEKKIKELDNILFKVGQSAQTVHMLTKPQAFYDNIHKQALGYQNPFHLRKAQWIKPTLYDGFIMSEKHVAKTVIDDEETLILKEKSRSKMFEKAKDPEIIDKNISHKPIDYEKLNRLSDDFRKRFTPQQEMNVEQAFWLHIYNPTNKPSDAYPVTIELLKVSLVNESLKKLKFHLAKFDNVVKIKTTPDARTEAQLQDKDNTICKLKDIIKSMIEKSKDKNVNYDYVEIETKNMKLENSVAKLILENERLYNEINHVKQVFNEQFDSIKRARVCTKEHSDSLIDKLNLKSTENEDLKAQIQYKVFVITSLKNDLQKIKEKEIVDITAPQPSANTIIPETFELDLEPLAPRNIKNKVEAQTKNVNRKNHVVEPIRNVDVNQSQLNANSELICATCKKSMFDGAHDI